MPKPENAEFIGIKICYLPAGNVVLGRVYRAAEFEYIEDGFTVRQWGTSEGIGELALCGPSDKTILDFFGTDDWHILRRIRGIDCDPDVWNEILDDKTRRSFKSRKKQKAK